jgi:PAS domain S-box-containing protein
MGVEEASRRADLSAVGSMNRFLLPLDSKRLARYGAGVGLAVLGLMARLALDPLLGQFAPWSAFFLAVVLAAVVGGFGSGAAAALSSVVLGIYFLLRPRYGFWPHDSGEAASTVVFLLAALTISFVGHALRRALQRRNDALAIVDALIDNSPVGISLFDRERRFVRVNPVVARTTGVPAQDHIGRRISEILPAAPGQTETKIARVVETGETIVDEEVIAEVPTIPGGPRTWQVSLFPVARQAGRVNVVGLLSRDITARKRGELERAENLRFAEQFMGVLAHDLRNPLAAIRMAADKVRRRTQESSDLKALDRILSSSARMERMIGQLLELTRSRLGGGIAISRTRGDLSQAVLAIVDELRLAYPDRQIDCDISPAVTGEWDFDRLARVVSNLVGNALVHGDPHAPVSVHVRVSGSCVRLDVHNVGPPIPETDVNAIFDPYHRRQSDRNQEGLGLGLFITKQIILAHGGTISVTSTPEDGTTFSVSLPMTPAASLPF